LITVQKMKIVIQEIYAENIAIASGKLVLRQSITNYILNYGRFTKKIWQREYLPRLSKTVGEIKND